MKKIETTNTINVERAKFKMTQADLAKEIGVSRQTIHLIETKQQDPRLGLARRIANFFNKEIGDIFSL